MPSNHVKGLHLDSLIDWALTFRNQIKSFNFMFWYNSNRKYSIFQEA